MDLDEHPAVGQRVTGDPDLGLRGGERGGVLKELGEEVHEVVDDPAGDLGRRDRGQFDALVLLHLGGGGAQDVDQRDRAGPAAARLLAGEDERFSPFRRMRVARWSSLKSEESWSGSASRDSSSEMSESWRWMRPWERRERLVNIALTLPRRRACSAARRTASRCTSSKAAATWPISSRECTPTDSTEVSTSCGSDSESCLTSSGRRSWATLVAVSWSRRSERIMDRATTKAPTRETPRTSRISAPLMMASRCDSCRSSRAMDSMSPSRTLSMRSMAAILVPYSSVKFR